MENSVPNAGTKPVQILNAKRPAGSRLAHSSFYEPIIEALIAKRKTMGLTQEVVNDMIGCCDALVSKWECRMRYPSAAHLMLWAQVLRMRIFAQELCHVC